MSWLVYPRSSFIYPHDLVESVKRQDALVQHGVLKDEPDLLIDTEFAKDFSLEGCV